MNGIGRESTKPKVSSIKRLIKLINPWQDQSQRQKVQCSNIENEKGNKTTNIIDFQEIIKEFNELLYATAFDNLFEIDKFLEKNNLPKCRRNKISE